MSNYRTAPSSTDKLPSGIPYILGNEVAERFSFYGMKAILVVFMTDHLVDAAGNPDYMTDEQAKGVYHLFTAAAYFFPILGALLADMFLGKYRTIIALSFGYCIGHACLAMGDTGAGIAFANPRTWLYLGLGFIAIGAGGIKPCVSAHLGDQFGPGNSHMLSKVFNWWYFSINVGSAISTVLIPWMLNTYGPWAAFGLPGVLMVLATLTFWIGRNRFVHIQPAGPERFAKETFSPEGKRALRNLAPLFLLFIPMFWAIFDQTGSAWVLQAGSMDLNFAGITWFKSQIQAANPILILILIPVFTYWIYPTMGKYFEVTPLRKIGIGLFLTAGAFSITGFLQLLIDGGATPNIGWQLIAYVALTAAEVMVSITSLEFAYTQAPKKMKSFLMGVYFMGVSFGNLFTSGVNFLIVVPEAAIEVGEAGAAEMVTKVINPASADSGATLLGFSIAGANYYWFFTGLMVVVSIIFVFFALSYRGETFIQDGDNAEGGDPDAGTDGDL